MTELETTTPRRRRSPSSNAAGTLVRLVGLLLLAVHPIGNLDVVIILFNPRLTIEHALRRCEEVRSRRSH